MENRNPKLDREATIFQIPISNFDFRVMERDGKAKNHE